MNTLKFALAASALAVFARGAWACDDVAAPAAVAATIEPVIGTLLALRLFNQQLTPLGWLGLIMVVGGVASGYLLEARGAASPAVLSTPT